MTAPTHDDTFHEIQLNGKQLVFLFMAATVVSVVIFLSGVMVGRGVRAERLAAAEATEALDEPTADAVTPPPADPPPAAIDLTRTEAPPTASEAVAPPPSAKATDESEEIRPDRPALKEPALLPAKPPQVVASTSSTAAKTTPVKESAPQAVAEPANTSKAAASANAADTTGGYAVQVAALDTRSEADAIAKRLSTKGYAAYVQTPAGTTSVYRVRVGMFKTRREADSIATKLQKEEHVKPWVTR